MKGKGSGREGGGLKAEDVLGKWKEGKGRVRARSGERGEGRKG